VVELEARPENAGADEQRFKEFAENTSFKPPIEAEDQGIRGGLAPRKTGIEPSV
jgi:hypothetical protein